jgi:hypothetical protein
MPTIVNTYAPGNDLLGTSLKSLGESMFGPGALQAGLVREKTRGLAMQNDNLPLAAEALARGDVNAAIRHGVQGGLGAKDASGYHLFGTANQPGSTPEAMTRAGYGAGMAWGSTPSGFERGQQVELQKSNNAIDRTVAGHQAVADNTPTNVLIDGKPVMVSRRYAIENRLTPVLSAADAQGVGRMGVLQNGAGGMTPPQLAAAGSEPQQPKIAHNYLGQDRVMYQTYDGLTDARSGRPLPPGAISSVQSTPDQVGLRPTVQGDMQKQSIALQKMRGAAGYVRELIQPNNVGLPGMVKGVVQDVTQTAAGLANVFGFTGPQNVLADIQQRVATGGVDGSVLQSLFTFDPKVPQLGSAYYGLVMTTADAFAGGASKASDRDVKMAINFLGDPSSLFASPQTLNAKLDAAEHLIAQFEKVNAPAMQNAPGAPTPTAAPGGGTGGAPARIKIDMNGNVIQ